MMQVWSVTHKQFSLQQSCTFAGELLGGLLWGSLTDKLGRRLTFIGTAALATFFGLLSAVSPNFSTFLITRFGLGVAIGGSLLIDLIYFAEFVPTKSRGIRTTVIIFLGICACITITILYMYYNCI